MKKLLLRAGLAAGTLGLVIAGAAAFSAFEAHVVNVTATIQNATDINTSALTFGTVFPQEILHQPVTLSLSSSFTGSGALGVDYVIKQKPKCQLNTEVAHDTGLPQYATVTENASGVFRCADDRYHMMPLLCPYLSKTSDVNTDHSVPAFHGPTTLAAWTDAVASSTAAVGHLTQNNPSTTWDIDLHVPCFQGECAQDWASYVHTANINAEPNAYMADINNKGEQMGCDLWYELTSVNRASQPVPTRYSSGSIQFGPNGWAGWSCPADKHAVGGGYEPASATVTSSQIAAANSVWPHYTFGASETGWVVQNNNDGKSLSVYVDCLPN